MRTLGAVALLAALALTAWGCGRSADGDPGEPVGRDSIEGATVPAPVPRAWTTEYLSDGGISVAYPRGWSRTEERLLSGLSDPREIVALATFDARPGGENCAHMPENALEAMKPTDALVVLEERLGGPETGGGTLADYPERPEHFDATSGYRSEAADCLDRPKPFFDRLIPFRDSNRRFYAYVAFGDEAPSAVREQAWAILDRLEIRPPDGRSFRLEHREVALDIPGGWDGRILFLDPQGDRALVQVANFTLPAQAGAEPAAEGPAGEEDPIKAMSGDDVVVTIVGESARVAPATGTPAIRPSDFLPASSRTPRGHAIAERSFCANGGCFRVEVDFARPPADPQLIERVNGVLASLSAGSR